MTKRQVRLAAALAAILVLAAVLTLQHYGLP
jgi:hypothetical protein